MELVPPKSNARRPRKPRVDAPPAAETTVQSEKPRRIRVRHRANDKSAASNTQRQSIENGGVPKIEVLKRKETTPTPRFAIQPDPFPSPAAVQEAKAKVQHTAAHPLPTKSQPTTQQSESTPRSDPVREAKPKVQYTAAPPLNTKPQQARRQRAPRLRKNQRLPSIFSDENQVVTRGKHGRILFSQRTVAEDPVLQHAQYANGPGVVSQELFNAQADEQLLEFQRLQISDEPALAQRAYVSGRKAYFDEYVSKEVALQGIESKLYHVGIVRISPKARKDAWVSVEDKTFEHGDVLLEGERSRNRALNGDKVVVKLLDDKVEERHIDRVRAQVVYIMSSRPLERIAGFIRPPGFEVGVAQEHRKLIANEGKKTSCQFHPLDNRIPWITINQRSLPPSLRGNDWIFNILQQQKTIFAARITEWDYQSRFPRGVIVEEIGAVGDIEAETRAILTDCDVDSRPHPAPALACLPSIPWSISEDEIARRRDFRKTRVCTIDPETARDLDDALSVRQLEDGSYEIGVHIADVSHFIEQDNALDMVARERATTVYLVQKAIPMLPRLLCEELCSLNPAVDRLAFSVTWTMNENGEEVGPRWYGRSVIRSAVRFAYGEAQNLLDGQSWEEGVGKPIDGGHTAEQITQDVKVLHRMSKAMRARRFENGALTINAFKLNFRLDKQGLPGVAEVYELKDANRLIEEFMLKANISVAEKIVDSFPGHALLRKHPKPKDRPLQEFVSYASKLGIFIDTSSSTSLQKGFNELALQSKDNPMIAILQNNAVKSMNRAEYMCTGSHDDPSSWAHYALAVPLYTHFTSPIRRYADVVVHRLLDRALQTVKAGFDAEACELWARNCNVRKENARTAQERSSMLYLCAYIEETCRQRDMVGTDTGMEMDAIIIAVRDRSVDVIVPKMALEKRLYYDKSLSISRFSHDPDAETTSIRWRSREARQTAIRKHVDDNTSGAVVPTDLGLSSGDHLEQENVTTLKVMDKIRVYLRGDFSSSPCEVRAGFVGPN